VPRSDDDDWLMTLTCCAPPLLASRPQVSSKASAALLIIDISDLYIGRTCNSRTRPAADIGEEEGRKRTDRYVKLTVTTETTQGKRRHAARLEDGDNRGRQ